MLFGNQIWERCWPVHGRNDVVSKKIFPSVVICGRELSSMWTKLSPVYWVWEWTTCYREIDYFNGTEVWQGSQVCEFPQGGGWEMFLILYYVYIAVQPLMGPGLLNQLATLAPIGWGYFQLPAPRMWYIRSLVYLPSSMCLVSFEVVPCLHSYHVPPSSDYLITFTTLLFIYRNYSYFRFSINGCYLRKVDSITGRWGLRRV